MAGLLLGFLSKFRNVLLLNFFVRPQVDGSQVLIKYVDFGNCEVKSAADLRPLNKKRLSMPVRILKCKLYGEIFKH